LTVVAVLLHPPLIRQELIEFAELGLADLGQNAHQLLLRVDPVSLDTGDQGVQPRVDWAGVIMPGEEPALAANGHVLQHPLRGVVVDVQEAFLGVAAQRPPLVWADSNYAGSADTAHDYQFGYDALGQVQT
jgi:hypothetical protein